MGEEDEEFAVVDHSLTSDGIIEEYYVKYNDELVAVPADEATVVVIKEHDEETAHGAKDKKKVKKLDSDKEKKKERHWSDPETPEEKEKRLAQDKKDFGPGGSKQLARGWDRGPERKGP